MTTAAGLGLQTPQGSDFISQGDNAITHNANKVAEIYDKLKVFHTAPLTESSGLNTIPEGHHRVTNGAVSAALGLPLGVPGTLLKTNILGSGAATFLWQTQGSAGQVSRVYTAQLNGATRTVWKELGSLEPKVLLSDTVLDSLSTGFYLVTNRTVASSLGMPAYAPGGSYAPGSLLHIKLGNGWMETFTTIDSDPVESVTYRRAKALNGVIQPWRQVATSAGAEAGGDSSGAVRRELLQQGLTARKGGRIGTNGKGVIALRFDDYHQEFREKVLPLLKERGLPFTRVSTSETIHDEVIPESELTAMQTYSIDAGGEVWNHGRDHGNATGEASIYDSLIGALDTLRAKLPRIPIDCFAPPGGSVTYDGYMPSNEISNYADTLAGQQLFGHHALVSGYFQDSYYWPLNGELKDGLNHYSADTFALSRPIQYIGWARDWRVGIVLMWHSRPFDTTGNMSLADFTAFLDALVIARDAGEIEVLTVSGMAVADKGSSSRDDILVTHSGSNGFSESLPYPQYRKGICGSTRMLTATVTGAAGATVTSVIGESTKTHTIPAGGTLKLWHAATIPLDATSLTVSIDATTTNAQLLAV